MRPARRACKTATALRQDQIARAALRIIARSGLSALSISALAREVGIVPAGICRHFKGKNEIMDAVLRLIHAQLMANVWAVKEAERGPCHQADKGDGLKAKLCHDQDEVDPRTGREAS